LNPIQPEVYGVRVDTERRNSAQARAWLERARKLQKPQSTAGIEAEIAMTEGRFEDAIQRWTAAREFIA